MMHLNVCTVIPSSVCRVHLMPDDDDIPVAAAAVAAAAEAAVSVIIVIPFLERCFFLMAQMLHELYFCVFFVHVVKLFLPHSRCFMPHTY